MFMQFFETFTDFDSKLWRSLGPLLFKPGFLTREFLAGKRKSYLNPVQMYAFFSFLFFITAFYLPDLYPNGKTDAQDFVSGMKEGMQGSKPKMPQQRVKSISISTDSLVIATKADLTKQDSAALAVGAGKKKASAKKSENQKSNLEFSGLPETVAKYDSIQQILAESERDGFLKNRMKRKLISLNERFNNDEDQSTWSALMDAFKGNVPNIIILLLPLAALGLKVLYFRKKWYYIEHLIFAIHFHSFAFLVLSIYNLIDMILPDNDWSGLFIFLAIAVYGMLALKYMFRQGWLRTFIKFNVLAAYYSMLLLVGLILNLVVAALLMA